MSGVLHPVGPEPTRTYWVRRGILLAVVVLLALGVVFALVNLTNAAVATSPPPAIPPANSASAATPSPTTTGTTPSAPTPTTSPTGPHGSTTAAAPSTAASTSARRSTPKTGASASAKTETSAKRSATPTAKPSPKPTTVGTPDCKPGDLRVKLKGDRTLSPGQKNKFSLALINGDTQTCLISITDQNFELKIYSGKDRIWSSRDCGKAVDAFDKKLASRADVGWTVSWNGKRSVKGERCKTGAETPRPGTYWATAQLKGADPVQLRMIMS